MARVAVRCEDVRKRFVIRRGRARTFQEAALALFQGGQAFGQRDEFWALDGVSFSVEAGRTLGIIGRNGAGKSTLLKLLAGTMQPTSGRMIANGKVFGLLELAAGFHPDLSGRENVFLNGAFLGRSHADMAKRLDEIIAFSELEQFIDQPVKHYSSGMYMRLGFAVALSVEPDILIVDEVLAVGDAAFRQKCLAALATAKAQGRTILFVTHDPGAVRRFCDDAVWLERGKVQAAGPALDVLRAYLATTTTHGAGVVPEGPPADPYATPRGPIALTGVDLLEKGEGTQTPFRGARTVRAPGDAWRMRLRYSVSEPVSGVSFGVAVHRDGGTYVLGAGTSGARHDLPVGDGAVIVTTEGLPLAPGLYSVSAGLWLDGASPEDGDPPDHRLTRAARVAVETPRILTAGLLAPRLAWEWPEDARIRTGLSLPHPIAPDENALSVPPSLPTPEPRMGRGFHGRFLPAPSRLTVGGGEDEFLGPGWHAPEDWPPAIRWTGWIDEDGGSLGRSIAAGASPADPAYAPNPPLDGGKVGGRRRLPVGTVFLTQDEWATALGVTLCRPHARADDADPVIVTIRVDGGPVGRLTLGAALLEPYTFPIEPVDTPREITVTIEAERPVLLDPAGTDRRILGVAVREVWVE
ncbi:MAG: ABC transporter ATP-binding protein [Proteobacteria bacterium]|nr:ABC transporter ATP-binding protein [Pseudomonadota bacterium]NBT04246.1 ABC transporter ATP-binding protein [Pseudomonadota bacterium]NBT17258.1 ABC transporter ATP-binding protein [Pseudomonadota bacterium]